MHYQTIQEIAELLRAKKISPLEVVRTMLNRIESLNGHYHPYITVCEETALAQARIAEQEIQSGMYRGPMHGIPVAVKDLIDTAGIRTTGGMRVHKDRIPSKDATVIRRLSDAGAILLGKLNLTEGAYTNNHPDYPTPINPWGADLWAGTSSHGSGVATALGMTYGALSTDTGGSIRFPAASNGITGIKPTWGRVSRAGVLTLSHSLDHVGPFARSVWDATAILQAIAGPDSQDSTAHSEPPQDYLSTINNGIRGMRIGIDSSYALENVEPEVSVAVEQAREILTSLGATFVEVKVPDPFPSMRGWFDICAAETAKVHAETYPSRAEDYQAGLVQLIEHGLSVSGVQVADAWVKRLEFTGALKTAMSGVDMMLTPTMISPTPHLSEVEAFGEDDNVLLQMARYTQPYDLSRNPTIVLPGGFSKDRRPVSVQLIGHDYREDTLMRAGFAYQSRTDWHTRHPIAE